MIEAVERELMKEVSHPLQEGRVSLKELRLMRLRC